MRLQQETRQQNEAAASEHPQSQMPAETGALEVDLDTRVVRPSKPRSVVEDGLDESMQEDIVLDDGPGHESDARVQVNF